MPESSKRTADAVLTPSGKIWLAAAAIGFAVLGALIGVMALGLAQEGGDPKMLFVLIPHTALMTAIFSGLMAGLLFFESERPVRGALILEDDAGGTPVDVHTSDPYEHQMERRRTEWTAWEYAGRRDTDHPEDRRAA